MHERLKLPSHELIALRDQNAMLENALLNERDASRASGIEMEEQLKAVTEQRDEALSDLEFRRDLFTLQEQQLNDVRSERVKLGCELSTAREELAKFKSIAETAISDHEMSEIRNHKLTQQRDRLAYLSGNYINSDTRLAWEAWQAAREALSAVTEQWDKALKKIENQSERIRYLEGATNHATGTPLSKAIEQRDRLAEALNKIQLVMVDGFDKLKRIDEIATEALQSLTPKDK
jgi:uncharacterized protein (DUF3084 family)